MVRNTMLALLAILILVTGTAWAQESGGLRYTVAVSKFDNQAGYRAQWDMGDAWAAVLTDALNQTGRFIVLGEADMRAAAMDEQDFGASGRTAGGSRTPATGQMTPAQILVRGAITHVQDRTSGGGGGVSVRGIRVGGRGGQAEINSTIYMVDSSTGQVLASKSVTGEAGSRGFSLGYCCRNFAGNVDAFKNDNVGKAVMASAEEAVDWMLSQIANMKWTGSVVMNRDGKIYINRGEREGVTAGQVFIIGDAEVLRDPDTGEVLDEIMDEVARVRVESVREKLSIATVIDGNANAIDTGMTVHAR
jgi:curli biogenesis system outer membrane secretion channel CsgG